MNKLLMLNNSLKLGKYLWNETHMERERFHVKEFGNYTASENLTFDDEEEENDYIFDRLGVRVPFIILYSIVFCCCVLGNLMVILLVFLSRRLKSTTNFFLANLAFADLCVGIFCIFQNLGFYLITTWVFGDFLCKMNQFIHGLSCTASVFILVVICIERYLAIIHPIRCKQILTRNRLRIIITLVWIISTAYSMPRYLISHTISNPLSGSYEIICIMSRIRYNSKLFDIVNFILLYLLPLGVMTVFYSLIAVRLWNSSLNYPPIQKCRAENNHHLCRGTQTENMTTSFTLSVGNSTYTGHRRSMTNSNRNDVLLHPNYYPNRGVTTSSNTCYRSSKNVLRARRRVIRMLTIIVLTFAICHLPFHARKMWQYWSKNYDGASTFSSLFTPVTFLSIYCNSAINPLLYAFLSKNFQKSMKEFLICSCRSKSSSRPLSFRQKSPNKSLSRACSVVSNNNR